MLLSQSSCLSHIQLKNRWKIISTCYWKSCCLPCNFLLQLDPGSCQLDPQEQTSVKFEWQYANFHSGERMRNVVCKMSAILFQLQCVNPNVFLFSVKPKCLDSDTEPATDDNSSDSDATDESDTPQTKRSQLTPGRANHDEVSTSKHFLHY